jgi:His/Glu/Gln/Arg/opine family amino acid ABC transporter permease subunit
VHFEVIGNNWQLIAAGVLLTLEIAVSAIVIGLGLGLMVAIARMSRVAPLAWLATSYVEVIRNTPALVQLLLIFLGLAEFRLRIAAVPAVILALGINNGAYLSEIIRGGLQSVQKGQVEAAAALGLPGGVTFREIVLPQGLRSVYPSLGNQFIQTVLASSIGSIIGAPELTQQINFIDSRSFRTIELLAFLTVAYAVLTLILATLVRLFGRRLERAYR